MKNIVFDEYQTKFLNTKLSANSVYVINALPGTGKSTIIAEKCNMLINEDNVNKDDIVAVTFSNRASRDLMSKMKYGNKVSTIHSMMTDLLRRSNVEIKIINDWSRSLILREAVNKILKFKYDTMRELNLITYNLISLINYYTINHSLFINIDNFNINDFKHNFTILDNIYNITNKQFIEVYKWFNEFKVSNNLWDYDDLISMRAINQIDRKLNENVKYVFLDEAQDQDILMYNIISELFNHTAITLIGDVFQRIYSFRYSYSYPMEEPYKFFENKEIFEYELVYNYRSVSNIVKVFNACRQSYNNVQAIPTIDELKSAVKILNVKTDIDEGKIVASEIQRYLDLGYNMSDIVVLVRKSSYIKSIIEPALINNNINYRVITPLYRRRMYELDINKLCLSIISAYVYSDISYLYSVADLLDGIGEKYKNTLMDQYINSNIDTTDKKYMTVKALYDAVIFFPTDGNIHVFFSLIEDLIKSYSSSIYTLKSISLMNKIFKNFIVMLEQQNSNNIRESLERIVTDISAFEDEMSEDKITVSTIFQYKGLEQKVVILTENTYVGSLNSDDEPQICYVGLSRAKERMSVIDSQYSVDRRFNFIKSKLLPSWEKTKTNLNI